jgi:hypothetical protein
VIASPPAINGKSARLVTTRLPFFAWNAETPGRRMTLIAVCYTECWGLVEVRRIVSVNRASVRQLHHSHKLRPAQGPPCSPKGLRYAIFHSQRYDDAGQDANAQSGE